MHSLRWRIAAWYAMLLVAAILALGMIVSLRFEQILYGQAQAHLALTMQDIKRVALPPPGQFSIQDTSGDSLLTLENADNLERWASAGTFIEIEDTRGHDLAKSFNLGSHRVSAASYTDGGQTDLAADDRSPRHAVLD